MKKCPKCNEVKPFDEFFKNKNKASGYNSYCKECCKDRDRTGNLLYQKAKDVKERKTLADNYIIKHLKNKGFEKIAISPDLIQIQRLLLILKRNINELRRNNRPTSGSEQKVDEW